MTLILEGLALLFGFYMAWNIGANDVSNAIGTSVGSKALTLKRAIYLAAVLEFAGAFFAGSSVSETLQKNIVCFDFFASEPNLFVIGMLGALMATGALLQIASYFGLPVSTTHAIVGAIVGFGLYAGGIQAVYWGEVGRICCSWVVSPLLSCAIAFVLFASLQRWVLRPAFQGGNATITGSEKVFVYFQVISASCVAFAHGANDVSNAIGPVAAIFSALSSHQIAHAAPVPTWLLLFGGIGIVLGLATWGWRVIDTVGRKITELTPLHGCAAEAGTALTVLLASKMGLPVSTTHALIGAIFGVGLVRGGKAINKALLKNIVASWFIFFPLCALLSMGMFYCLKIVFSLYP